MHLTRSWLRPLKASTLRKRVAWGQGSQGPASCPLTPVFSFRGRWFAPYPSPKGDSVCARFLSSSKCQPSVVNDGWRRDCLSRALWKVETPSGSSQGRKQKSRDRSG